MTCEIRREVHSQTTTLRVSGRFDLGSALALRQHLQREMTEEVVLDFSLVSHFADASIEVLVAEINRGGRRVLLRGIREHQVRLLRYFGIEGRTFEGA